MKEIKNYIISTFILTYISWGIVVIFTQVNKIPFGLSTPMLILYIIGVISPAICAIAVKSKEASKEEFKYFLKNIIRPSRYLVWYIIIVVFAIIFKLVPFFLFGGIKRLPVYMILLQLPLFILIGGLEEIGWRGLLLPSFQKRFTALKSTVIVGIIWTIWHLPLFFIIGTYQELYSNFLTFALYTLSFSFILSIVYNNTKSIFMCIFCHAVVNAIGEVFAINETLISGGTMLLISIVVFFTFDFISKKIIPQNEHNFHIQ
jgi:membrane protease YdiL (CAAX protease family)